MVQINDTASCHSCVKPLSILIKEFFRGRYGMHCDCGKGWIVFEAAYFVSCKAMHPPINNTYATSSLRGFESLSLAAITVTGRRSRRAKVLVPRTYSTLFVCPNANVHIVVNTAQVASSKAVSETAPIRKTMPTTSLLWDVDPLCASDKTVGGYPLLPD
jgi:hypothetical protein